MKNQQRDMSPSTTSRVIETLKEKVSGLQGDLERQKEALTKEFERKVEQARRETRDKVQRVMEKRFKKGQENNRSQSTGGVAKEETISVAEPLRQTQNTRPRSTLNTNRGSIKETKQNLISASAKVLNSRNLLPQTTPSFQKKNNAPQPENLTVSPAPAFQNFEAISLQEQYEAKLHSRL